MGYTWESDSEMAALRANFFNQTNVLYPQLLNASNELFNWVVSEDVELISSFSGPIQFLSIWKEFLDPVKLVYDECIRDIGWYDNVRLSWAVNNCSSVVIFSEISDVARAHSELTKVNKVIPYLKIQCAAFTVGVAPYVGLNNLLSIRFDKLEEINELHPFSVSDMKQLANAKDAIRDTAFTMPISVFKAFCNAIQAAPSDYDSEVKKITEGDHGEFSGFYYKQFLENPLSLVAVTGPAARTDECN